MRSEAAQRCDYSMKVCVCVCASSKLSKPTIVSFNFIKADKKKSKPPPAA